MSTEPTILRLYCSTVSRKEYGWRDTERARKHSLDTTFEEAPDEDVPCPVRGCTGHLVVRPPGGEGGKKKTAKKKTARKPRRKKT
jgi:hypothetical protein